MYRVRTRRSAGFTLIELFIVLILMMVVAIIFFPALDHMMIRAKLEGSGRDTAALMQRARFEAIRRNANTGVTQSFASNEAIAFVDDDGTAGFSPGDTILQRFTLSTGVNWYGPGDVLPSHTNASVGFTENASLEGTVSFRSDGSSTAVGAFRLGDNRGNFLEARVDPTATARVALQKYDPIAVDPNDPTNWNERSETAAGWKWSY